MYLSHKRAYSVMGGLVHGGEDLGGQVKEHGG